MYCGTSNRHPVGLRYRLHVLHNSETVQFEESVPTPTYDYYGYVVDLVVSRVFKQPTSHSVLPVI